MLSAAQPGRNGIISAGRGASAHMLFFDTGWMNSMRLAWRDIPPSRLLRLAPYFKSPFIGWPVADSWTRI